MAPKLTPKVPIDKLPLAVRKNLRDVWESKLPEYEERISKALGETWTIKTNPNLIYVCTEDESYKSRLGSVIVWYMDPFCDNLEEFIKNYGDDGKAELNSLCSTHQVEFAPQDDTTFHYGGLQIKDGLLRLVFADKYLASNVSEVSRRFEEAIKDTEATTDAGTFNILARQSVRQHYEPKIDEVREAIGKLVGVPDIKLTPNFEETAKTLSKGCSQKDWDSSLGRVILSYFEGLKSQLENAGFKGDDMLQEGFQEGVSKNEITFRVVDKLKSGTYNEVLIEDGVLVIQVVPNYWWSNADYTGDKILDLL